MSRERWTPVRFIQNAQRCDFCGGDIPPGGPGSKVGTRGTKAWYQPDRRVWECLGCRTEGFRAEDERDKLDDARARQGGADAQGR